MCLRKTQKGAHRNLKSAHQGPPVITIDGPGGAGKSAIALCLAKKLGYHLLDSGAIYRSLAYCIQKRYGNQPPSDQKMIALAEQMQIRFVQTDCDYRVLLDTKEDITDIIRSPACASLASYIAVKDFIRQALLCKQRDFLQSPGLVAEGRDMGSVVFPNAHKKFFLTASVKERAKRRCSQLQKTGMHANLTSIETALRNRDQRDMQRLQAPLKLAEGAILIDTTQDSIENVLNCVLNAIKTKSL